MQADQNLHASVIDANTPGALSWVFQGEQGLQPPGVNLDDLPIEVDWSRKRMIWVLYGSCHMETLEDALSRITDCSKLVVLEAQAPNAYHLSPAELVKLLTLVMDGQLSLIVGGSLIQRADQFLKMVDINLFDGWKPLLSQAVMNAQPEKTRQLFERLASGLNSKILSKRTYMAVAMHYLRNTLVNAPLAAGETRLQQWAAQRSNQPVLIVAAGPSLNKQLPMLAANQDLFTILAVNTVWPILEKHGIVPDAVLSLDRNSRPSWPQKGISQSTAFCVDMGCAPELLWSHDHNHVITACDPITSAIAGSLGAKGEFLRTGGSVATSAFSLAVLLGGNPLVLIGQDLALTDGRDHAEGYPHTYNSQTLKHRTDNGFDVEGYHGGRVRTERQLMFYKTWFEERIKELPDRLIINATEGGARIEGALQVPFASICQEIRSTSLRKRALMEPYKRSIDAEHMANLRQGLVGLKENISAFGKLASEGRSLCRITGKKPGKKQMARIDRMNQKLKDHEPLSKHFVDVMCMTQLESIRYTAQTGEGMDGLADAVKKYDEVYQNIESAATLAQTLLDQVDRFYQRVSERGEIDPSLVSAVFTD